MKNLVKKKFEKRNFWSKIESYLKNRNVGQNFGKKAKTFSKIEIFVKNLTLVKNVNFCQK